MEYLKKMEKGESSLIDILLSERFQISTLFLSLGIIPFLFDKSQYFTGTLVNMILALGVAKFGMKKVWPMILLPSASTYIHGVIFGGATNFLIYLIPAIILGNLVYALLSKGFKKDILNVVFASLLKTGILFSTAYILHRAISLPEIFLTTMGIMQLITALSGGFIAYTITKQYKESFN